MKAAYFREDWLDKANQLLTNPADRACFYECLMCRAFGRSLPDFSSPIVSAMYAMAESAIVADIEKYEAKCERNRQNALSKASRTQSHPVAATGCGRSQSLPSTNTSPSPSTNTSPSPSTNTSPISSESVGGDREIYLIYCTLFQRGALNLQTEFDQFYNYYAALGWKNNKGAPIVSKVSAAAMWRLSGDTCGNLSQREIWARAFRNAPTTSILVWLSFRDMQVEVTDTTRVLHLHTTLNTKQIENLEDKCEKQLRTVMAAYECTQLQYHCQRS